MFCPQCGSELKDGAKFCPKCGTSLAERAAGREEVPRAQDGRAGAANAATNVADLVARVAAREGAGEAVVAGPVPASQAKVFLALDAVMFFLMAFVPWVGSSYVDEGHSLSLPQLVLSILDFIGMAKDYSSTASQLGMGKLYDLVICALILIALAAGIGCFIVIQRLFEDVKCDLRYQEAPGKGGHALMVLAIVVQVTVWISVAIIKASLKNQYIDLSFVGTGILKTTGWVWLSMGVGFASTYFRKKYDKGLGGTS